MSKHLLWLDCDPGPDDALAIFLAAYSPSVQLIGISTVHGNSSLEKVTNNALSVLRLGGITNVPVYRGCEVPIVREPKPIPTFHGETGIGNKPLPPTEQTAISENVFEGIYQLIKSQPKKVRFVATGSFSNIAMLLMLYPDFPSLIEDVTIMGGSVERGNITPTAEVNMSMDPEAAQILFKSGVPLTMVPLELTYQVQVNAQVISRIREFGTYFSEMVIDFLSFYMFIYKETYGWDYAALHDPCAVYYVINPSVFETKFQNVEIETKSKFCDGRTVVDKYNITGRKANCNVAYNMEQAPFWEEMIATLAKANELCPCVRPDVDTKK